MKYYLALLATAQICVAADFHTGQAARLVIGQRTFTESAQGATNFLVGAASGLAYSNGKLFVVDSNRFAADPVNNRVLIFPTDTLPGPKDVLAFPPPPGQTPDNLTCLVCARAKAAVVLGQPDFNNSQIALTATGMRTPTAVATDGTRLAVADTDNNRILIWNTIPSSNTTPADVVVGQPDFTHNATAVPPTAKSMRGPQGVWMQDGKLFVADTQDNRVLIYNSIPTANGAAADVVLGVPNLATGVPVSVSVAVATANNLLNPVSVTSDGRRLVVTDLGANRVLIWNSIPTTNQAPADVVLGQPDFTSAIANNSSKLCASNGTDTSNNPTYPALCKQTMSFPRFALLAGGRLFVADSGNDRVLVYSSIPTANATPADIVLGQPDDVTDASSDNADAFQTPSSLAWDGTNLYVTDTFNRRILVFSPGDQNLPPASIRNGASLEVFAIGTVTIGGTIAENDTVTVTITTTDANGTATNTPYKYTVKKTDTLPDVVKGLVALINAPPGDPNVIARPDITVDAATQLLTLTAKKGGATGGAISYSTTLSTNAVLTATTTGATLSINLQDAAKVAAGSLVTIFGSNLADTSAVASFKGDTLPNSLGNVQVYFDGIPSPLVSVSPTQINAQLPFEVQDRTSVSAYVRTTHADGTVSVSTPEALSVVIANPGVFAEPGTDPRVAVVYHAYTNSTGVVSVDGAIKAGDIGTITVGSETFTYTVVTGDTLQTIRDKFVALINADEASPATAAPSNVFTRIVLTSKTKGTDANAVAITAAVTGTSAQLILTALTSNLCCGNAPADTRVTNDNPAVPGETLYLYATGLGPTTNGIDTGRIATAANQNDPPVTPVDSILAGGSTANVLFTGFAPGLVGVYQLYFQLSSSIPSDPLTQLTIAQQSFVSNVVTFPVVASLVAQ